MATLDRDRGVLIVRIVYDGPPQAGKTTSLRTLARFVDRDTRSAVYSPGEMDGRTRFFDWMLYRAGRMDGYRVFCQVMSVPGQSGLADRRRLMIEAADAVIFVANTRQFAMQGSLISFGEMKGFVADAAPPVGIVLQANKRDLPGCVPMAEVRATLGGDDPYLAFVPGVATSGQGVKDAFGLGVSLALDRARVLLDQDDGFDDTFGVRSGEDLLRMLERASDRVPLGPVAVQKPPAASSHPEPEASNIRSRPASSAPSHSAPSHTKAEPVPSKPPPALPNSSVPTGCIWPPIAGRVLLQRLEAVGLQAQPTPEGGWRADAPHGWRVVSAPEHRFSAAAPGRTQLLEWARMLVALGPRVSADRSLALAATGRGAWRLWQVLIARESIADALATALGTIAESSFGDQLAITVRRYEEAVADLVADVPWASLRPEEIGFSNGRPCIVGLSPPPSAAGVEHHVDVTRTSIVERMSTSLVEAAKTRGVASEVLVAHLEAAVDRREELADIVTATVAQLEAAH